MTKKREKKLYEINYPNKEPTRVFIFCTAFSELAPYAY